MAQTVKNLPAMQETQVWSLVRKIPWRREWQPPPVFLPGKAMVRAAWWATVHGMARVGHDLATNTSLLWWVIRCRLWQHVGERISSPESYKCKGPKARRCLSFWQNRNQATHSWDNPRRHWQDLTWILKFLLNIPPGRLPKGLFNGPLVFVRIL